MAKKKKAKKKKSPPRARPRPGRLASGDGSPRAARGKKSVRSDGDHRHRTAEPVPESAPAELPPSEEFQRPPFTVVGVGASAGGLEACTQMLRALPADGDLAFVIVQHMAPGHDSLLPELLAGATSLPVVHVADGMRLEPGRVHVTVPGVQIGIVGGALQLTARSESAGHFMPIDAFFRSLAQYAGPRAVGVVLSGNASDGAMGLRDIKAAGGITIAQEPRTAKFDGMPRAAVATGAVDLTLGPRDIAEELVRIAHHPLVAGEAVPLDPALQVGEDEMFRIFTLLRNATGVDFKQYKSPTIRRRLQRRMVLHKIPSVGHYLRFLQQNPAELESLYRDLLINVTRFFREPESFEALAREVFPRIAKGRTTENPIRIWVPGCSTGEEAYSVGISLLEFLGENASAIPVQIFATDVSESAVEHARQGSYPESIAADVSAERLRRFFNRVDGRYRVSKTVRDLCVFARQDLTRDPPFSKLDLVVCRNVLIYLGSPLQKKLIQIFHYALRPQGFLMLGGAETIGPQFDLFSVAEKRHKIYLRKPATAFPDQTSFMPGFRYEGGRPAGGGGHAGGRTVQDEANRVVLERFVPPGVLVDNDLQIVQFRGQTGPYLEASPGQASLNLLKMAREGLLYGLRSAIHESRKSGAPIIRSGLHVKHNGGSHEVRLEVIPMEPAERRHFLILFHDAGDAPAEAPPARRRGKAAKGKRPRAADDNRLTHLHHELAASREYMQSIIHDLEAANEELQSANEEVLSSNEELQSTNEELDTAKEELQSTNEELNTVNEELLARNDELRSVNSDLVNLLASVQIAIIMVSADCGSGALRPRPRSF